MTFQYNDSWPCGGFRKGRGRLAGEIPKNNINIPDPSKNEKNL